MAQSTLMSPPTQPCARTKITYEEFLDTEWENPHVEWVDGEVIEMSPVGLAHTKEARWLISILGALVERNGSGEILFDPFQMKTGPNLSGRQPDILFVATENLHRLHETYLEGPADLAIEIISPGSGGTDRGDKFYEYEKGGVKEYWLIDPIRKQVDLYRLGSDALFHTDPLPEDRILRSDVLPGFWVKVEWLWQESRPSVLSVLKEWNLI